MPSHSAVTLGDRVRKMLEEKGWSQAKLAEEADLAPPALSKLLSGERNPGMEHFLGLARALGLTPLELVNGTSAEAVLEQWVPRAELDGEARTRQEAQQAASKLRAEIAERDARILALEASNKGARSEVMTLRAEVENARAAAAAATAKVQALERERASALALAQRRELENAQANSRVRQLAAQLLEAKGDVVKTSVVTGALSVIGTLLMTSGAKSSPRPRPYAQTRRKTDRRR